MTILEKEIISSRLGYGISDADQHFYEPAADVAGYLEPEFKDVLRLAQVGDHTRMLVNDQLHVLIPNPTYDPVAPPGSMVEYFRANNPEGRTLKEIAGPQMALDPAFRYRDQRMKVLDEQGVDLCIMLPTLALGLEEMLTDDPRAMSACVRALNKWTLDEWSWNIDERVFVTGVVSLIEPDEAVAELKTLIESGCKVVGMRPGPVNSAGIHRSIADPVFDPFWSMADEAGVVIALHAADTPYSHMLEAWGEAGRWKGHKTSSLSEVMGIHTERVIYDTMAAMVCHGLFDRHPGLKIATLEIGAGWVGELVRRFKIAYGKAPQNFKTDPVEQFIEHTWVMPFFEDDVHELVRSFPVERVIYGSDYPHPEGLALPEEYVDDLVGFSAEHQRMIMRDNLRDLLQIK